MFLAYDKHGSKTRHDVTRTGLVTHVYINYENVKITEK